MKFRETVTAVSPWWKYSFSQFQLLVTVANISFTEARSDIQGCSTIKVASVWRGQRRLTGKKEGNNWSYPGTKSVKGKIKDKLRVLSVTWLMRLYQSVQFSCTVVSDCLRPHGLQHTRPPCASPSPGVHQNSCPLSRWCHPTISSTVVPFSPTFSLSQHEGLFKRVSSLHQVAKVLKFQHQHQSFQ